MLASGKLDAADRVLQAAELALEPGPDRAAIQSRPDLGRPDLGRQDNAPQERGLRHGLDELSLQGRIATTRAFSAFTVEM